jgi:hypothetical protein
MANTTITHKQNVRHLVKEYIQENGVPSTLKMQDHLQKQGHGVSTGTIAEIYRELGYEPKRQRAFVWKHKESHE